MPDSPMQWLYRHYLRWASTLVQWLPLHLRSVHPGWVTNQSIFKMSRRPRTWSIEAGWAIGAGYSPPFSVSKLQWNRGQQQIKPSHTFWKIDDDIVHNLSPCISKLSTVDNDIFGVLKLCIDWGVGYGGWQGMVPPVSWYSAQALTWSLRLLISCRKVKRLRWEGS